MLETQPISVLQDLAPESKKLIADAEKDRLNEMEDKINKIYISVKRIQFYFLITTIITIAAIVIPLIGLAFVIPNYINQISGEVGGNF